MWCQRRTRITSSALHHYQGRHFRRPLGERRDYLEAQWHATLGRVHCAEVVGAQVRRARFPIETSETDQLRPVWDRWERAAIDTTRWVVAMGASVGS